MTPDHLLPDALDDLREIAAYIATEWSEDRAAQVLTDLLNALDRIGDMPTIGHFRPDLDDKGRRFYRVHRFLIIYDAEARPPRIMRILHGHRNVKSILKRS